MTETKEIPQWWALCPNSQCKKADGCLRYLLCKQMSGGVKTWKCVLPNAWKDEDCTFYKKYETVRMARGFRQLYNSLHSRDARGGIRLALTALLGSKGSYYRFRDGERVMNPALQQKVIDIVHQYVPDMKVEFDETFDDYDLTTL